MRITTRTTHEEHVSEPVKFRIEAIEAEAGALREYITLA